MSPPGSTVGALAAATATWLIVDAVLRSIALTRLPAPRAHHPEDATINTAPSTPMPTPRQAARHRRAGRRRPVGPTVVASWLDAVAAAVRSGDSLRTAVIEQRLDPSVDQRLTPLRVGLERGEQLTPAVARWNAGLEPDDHLTVAAMALTTAAEVGGTVTQPLERSAAILRQTAAGDDERRSWSSQARLSAVVMTALPPVVLGLLIASGSAAADALQTPLGAGLVAAGLVLDALGFWWMRAIVRRADR